MLAQTYSLAHYGANPSRVTIETDVYNGLPGIRIVGLPSKAIDEARERIRSAIRNSDLDFPARKYTINMAPADIAKTGTGYELGMAIGILIATSQIEPVDSTTCFVAELALDGSLRPAKDCLASVLTAANHGFTTIVVDPTTIIDSQLCEGITIFRPHSLRELYLHYLQEKPLPIWKPASQTSIKVPTDHDLSDVRGLTVAKRALEIAAAGHHNLLLIGPPGSGKSLLAQNLPGILPQASLDERREIYYLHSLANQDPPHSQSDRPFRSPHHTASTVAITGGGTNPRPGEISLAHHGVLFMDEFVEFPHTVLESLRQPLEDATITISRAADTLQFPANVLLIAAMNRCPCGHYGNPRITCSCSPAQITRYLKKLSGPLLDRFDLIYQVQPFNPSEWFSNTLTESSSAVRSRIEITRNFQIDRMHPQTFIPNSRVSMSGAENHVSLSATAQTYLHSVISQGQLSARGISRCQKVARTIADLEGSLTVEENHLQEALFFKQHKLFEAALESPVPNYG